MNSTPSPPIRQFEGDFLGDVDGFAVDLLIITIIQFFFVITFILVLSR